jgi:mannose-6-phosphate isomerase-like protein (cupin superfamily)
VYYVYTSLFYPLLLKAALIIHINQRRIQINRRTAMGTKHHSPVEGQEVSKMEDFIKSGKETREFARIGEKGEVAMANHREGVHTVSKTGRAFWGPGDMYTFLITGEQSDGAFFVMEALVPPGGGPPPHIHRREDETFYILDGECSIRVGKKILAASSGDFISIPRDTLHCFKNVGMRMMKMILTFVPAGIEKFFEEVFEPVHDRSATSPPTTKELIDRLVAAGPRYGCEFYPVRTT